MSYSTVQLNYLNFSSAAVQLALFSFRIVKKNNGRAPLEYQRFLTVFNSLPAPPEPLPEPSELLANQKLTDGIFNEKRHGVPSLEELGVSSDSLGTCFYPGGETEALARMKKSLSNQVGANEIDNIR